MRNCIIFLLCVCFSSFCIAQAVSESKTVDDHEKAIKAVNEGEILPLDEILVKVNQEFAGRVISINLKDNEKGLFGWVYDIMIIEPEIMLNNLELMQEHQQFYQLLVVKNENTSY